MDKPCGTRAPMRPLCPSPCYQAQESPSPTGTYTPQARPLVLAVRESIVWPVLLQRKVGPRSESAYSYIGPQHRVTRSSSKRSNLRVLLTFSFISQMAVITIATDGISSASSRRPDAVAWCPSRHGKFLSATAAALLETNRECWRRHHRLWYWWTPNS